MKELDNFEFVDTKKATSVYRHKCRECGNRFKRIRRKQRLCSDECKSKFLERKRMAAEEKAKRRDEYIEDNLVDNTRSTTFGQMKVEVGPKDNEATNHQNAKVHKKYRDIEIKKCPVCRRNFGTDKEERKHCSKQCYDEHNSKIIYKKKKQKHNTCPTCKKQFVTGRGRVYCSRVCRPSFTVIDKETSKEITTAMVGTIHELNVSMDLLKRGYHVFRSLSPACPCDLIILKHTKKDRVEITKGYRNPITGKISFDPHDKKNYDIMAVSFKDGSILYIPPLDQ